MTDLNARLAEIIHSAIRNGYNPIDAVLDYMAEKDSPMPHKWAVAKVRAVLNGQPVHMCIDIR